MLYPREDRLAKCLMFICRKCGYETEASSPVVFKHEIVKSAVCVYYEGGAAAVVSPPPPERRRSDCSPTPPPLHPAAATALGAQEPARQDPRRRDR